MDKKILNTSSNRISFLYIEMARVEENEFTVMVIQGNKTVEIPIATISCIILGPGTSITHGAVRMFAECGCSIMWMGRDLQYMYCCADAGTHLGKNVLLQARNHQDKTLHMNVVRKMYSLRYPSQKSSNYSLAQLRGIEGKRLKELYIKLAEESGISWMGRKYDVTNFDEQDDINKCITWCNQFLYAIVKSVIQYMGFSCTLGFIHTGHIDSFIFDVADLYKEEISIPCAFEVIKEANGELYTSCRKKMHEFIVEKKLMSRISKDLIQIFDEEENEPVDIALWNVDTVVQYGKNYSSES